MHRNSDSPMRLIFVAVLPVFALTALLAGCGSDPAVAADPSISSESGKASATGAPGQTLNGAKVVTQPTGNVPPGGIVLQPPDPNDSRYKPDPRLSGGG